MCSLDIPFQLFESLKQSSPSYEVELIPLTQSTYKELKRAKIVDVEDYSIARNLNALSN